jgi:hypothetical protein
MTKKSIILIVFAGLFLLSSTAFCEEPMLLVPVLDENGNATGLFNVNADPDSEPWISGGGRALTELEDKCIPELVLPERYRDRKKFPLPPKVDNSRTKYYPPLLTQKGASCCQAAGTAYMFSYEVCRIRDLDASVEANIFPYGFAYNFINRGSTSTYSGFSDGWRMAEELGMPDLESYGGQLEGTASQTSWVDGYDVYHKAMNNRYIESYRVTCTTNDGIEKMKQWIFDRTDGSDPGGVMGFLAWSGQTRDELPSSSPEAGHTYIKSFGTSGGHCMTLVGYNDDITYDLDRDGKISEREQGGFLMVNSYGSSYGTDGRAYVPYGLFLDGSMKSSSVYGITVKEEFTPLITYKVKITHDTRNAIEIIRGYSTNTSATSPSETFRYNECFSNGGALPMEGKGLSETIEIGLDVSEFIEDISGKRTKFFLQIDSEGGSGKVDNFSVMDYTGGQVKEYECTETNVTISNGMTTLWVLTDDPVNISNTSFKRPNDNKRFYASPLTTGNNIIFKFSPLETNRAIFRIVNIHGQLVYDKGFSVNGANNFTWDVSGISGKRVAKGKYIAQLEYKNRKGIKKILYTQVYVMN